MNFFNSNRQFAEKEITECDLSKVYIISEDIHKSILSIVNSSVSQLLDLYEPHEIDDDILLTESDLIGEQTVEQLKKVSDIEINTETLYYIKHSISAMITMKFINEIEPYLNLYIGEDNGRKS